MKSIIVSAVALMGLVALAGCGHDNIKSDKNASLAPEPRPMQPRTTEVYPPPTSDNLGAGTVQTPGTAELTPAPAASSANPLAGKSYTVQKGDTLWNIAQRAYGDGKQYKKIVAANSIKGDVVKVGQKLTLPQ